MLLKKTAALLTAALLLVMIPVSCAAPSVAASQADPSQPAASGDPAESAPAESEAPTFGPFSAQTLAGEEVSEELFANSDLTMVNIWGTFCGPCINEMPELGELSAEYGDKGLQIVGIVSDVLDAEGKLDQTQVDLAKQIVEQTGAGYTHLLANEDLYQLVLGGLSGVPATLFLDKDGKLVGMGYMGARSKDQWTKIIDEKLAEVQG